MAEHIGLIGGIGPAATDHYYRMLIKLFADADERLELTIVHADTRTLLHNLETDDHDAQVDIYRRLTDRLKLAGATCVVITSIAGHFCIERFKTVSPLPVVDLVAAVADAIADRSLSRLGVLGTLAVMKSRFYSGLGPTDLVLPPEDRLSEIHDIYVDIAATGTATDSQRSSLDSICEWYIQDAQVDAILLGGTDLALIYREHSARFPVIDCAAIHARAAFRTANGLSKR